MTNRSKRDSLIEACADTISGFVMGIVIQAAVFPILGLGALPLETNLILQGIFLGVGFCRSYAIRRIFSKVYSKNAEIHQQSHKQTPIPVRNRKCVYNRNIAFKNSRMFLRPTSINADMKKAARQVVGKNVILPQRPCNARKNHPARRAKF